jgi:Rps23 Pro-64 3,4-dihydroxylase Tpa1-like proline 4-hydroxylase
MKPREILDSFSTTLLQDERILSAPERALLTTLLHHTKMSAAVNRETQEAVRAVIASAVGETIARRAFSVLGENIVEQILENSPLSNETDGSQTGEIYAVQPQPPGVRKPEPATPASTPGQPQPPGSQPQPPGVRTPTPPQPQPPGTTPPQPQPPGAPMKTPGQPQPPGAVTTTVVSQTGTEVADRPAILPAKCVVLDEFLAPQELDQLMGFALEHEIEFRASEVVSPTAAGGVINYEHRRSRVLMDLAQYQDLMLKRIRTVLPQVLEKLGMEQVPIAGVEAQITASGDGDFFCFHSDNGSQKVANRFLTFVYFFQREPRQFVGGELRIHDARLEGDQYVSEGTYQTILPQQNRIVFFPCELMHEVTPVECPSGLFADSRFTLNGWLLQ